MKYFKFLIGFLIVSTLSVACGSKDPMKKYAGMQAYSPEEASEIAKKNVVDALDNNPKAADETSAIAQMHGMYQVEVPENISFLEGKEKSFEMVVKFLRGQAEFDIDVTEIPSASFKLVQIEKQINQVKYKVSWKPEAGFVPSDKKSVLDAFKVSLRDIKFVSKNNSENEITQKLYEKLKIKLTDVSYVVRRDSKIPSLTVNNLGKDVKAGEIYKFSVDVVAPDTYTEKIPLNPEVFFDLVNLVNKDGMVVSNGAYFVNFDLENAKIETLSKNKWRIHYIFDTKNVKIPEQIDRDLKIVESAEKLFVSLSFRVNAKDVAISDKKTLRFDIELN